MTGLKILAAVVIVLFLLGRIRLGGIGEYSGEGLKVWLRVGAFTPLVYPRSAEKKDKEKKKGKKKPKPEPESQEEKRTGGSLALVKDCLPLVGEAAGELKRKIQVDRLDVDFISGSADAAGAAMAFGYANMAYGMVWPVFAQNFKVKEHRFRTAVDFTAESPVIYIKAAFSARLGQLLSFTLRFGWKFLKVYLANRKRAKAQKEAV